MKRRRFPSAATTAALIGSLSHLATAMTPAHAQASSAEERLSSKSRGVEEIVVTARKRSENLLDVPLSINAVTAEQIQNASIDSVADLATQTVGFSYRQGFGRIGGGQAGGESNRPSIRGMANIVGQPNAAFFVDGIFVSGNPTSYNLTNVERVEVIRGPQSALFGRGTFAGAINFVTRQPSNEFEGKISAKLGRFDHQDISGFVSGPLIQDKLFGELSWRRYDFGGDYRNGISGKRDIGAQKTDSVGAKLYATPTDDLSVGFTFSYSRDRDLGYAEFFNGSNNNNCFLPQITGTVGTIPRSATRSPGYFCGEIELPDQFYYLNDAIRAADQWALEREVMRYSLNTSYDIGAWNLNYTGAYNESRNRQVIDVFVDGNINHGLTPVLLGAETSVHDWSSELRLSSPQEGRLRGLAGLYYYQEGNGSGVGSYNISANPATFGQIIPSVTQPAYGDDASGVSDWAVFGLIEYEATDRLTLTAEARYQEDRPKADLNQDGVAELRTKFSAFLPRLTARYELTDGANIYASVAQGNKPGGFNVVPLRNMIPADIARVFADGAEKYKEEKLLAYEIGYKNRLWDGRATLSAAAYYNDWTNQGLNVGYTYMRISPPLPQNFTRILSAGKSRVMGIELDATVRASDYLDFRLGYTYANAEILDFIDETDRDLHDTDGLIGNEATQGDPTGQLKGRKIPQTPEHQFILTGDFHVPLNSELSGFFRSDLAYESSRYAQVHNLAYTGDSYLLNLKLGVQSDHWQVALFVDNALQDETPMVITRSFTFDRLLVLPDAVLSAVGPNTRLTQFRDFRVAAPRKREYGLTATYRF